MADRSCACPAPLSRSAGAFAQLCGGPARVLSQIKKKEEQNPPFSFVFLSVGLYLFQVSSLICISAAETSHRDSERVTWELLKPALLLK